MTELSLKELKAEIRRLNQKCDDLEEAISELEKVQDGTPEVVVTYPDHWRLVAAMRKIEQPE